MEEAKLVAEGAGYSVHDRLGGREAGWRPEAVAAAMVAGVVTGG